MKYILNNSENFEIIKSGDSSGLSYVPSSRTFSIDNTEIDDISYIELSPTKIYANHMCDGFFVDTNGGNWSLGSVGSASDNTCNISGYGGAINISACGSDDYGYGMRFDATNGGILISPIGTLRMHSGESNIELVTSDGWVNIESSENFNVMAKNIEIDQSGCYATAFYETSDENLKDFSNDINVDFNKLKEIRKSYFTWKDGDQNLHIGTSAQDIQKNYPELVSEDKNGNLTVDYAKLSLIALSAIDKLDERLSKIEKMLNIE